MFTIGHSTHPIDEFVRILRRNGVKRVVDVRTVAGSRHNPQFAEQALEASLPGFGIAYGRLSELGGLRHSRTNSGTVNGAWRNTSFRSYADYMQTADFASGIDALIGMASRETVAIMCAEAVPWRCHRSLIGDALLVRNIGVEDILSEKRTTPHTLTSFAETDGARVWYPAAPEGEG